MIQAFLTRIWHSPTFTSWGNKIAASARIFLVLPLLLNNLDQVELAAWLLFGTILFFGSILGAQTSLVLSRMVSVAYGGATQLAEIRSMPKSLSPGAPNWKLLLQLYQVMRPILLICAVIGAIISLVLGWFSLSALTLGHESASDIWCAFFIFIAGQFFSQLFRLYAVFLRGLNQVALSQRWEALFELLSAIVGCLILVKNGSIVHLALAMQVIILLGNFCQWYLLTHNVEPRFYALKSWIADRQIFLWTWQPLKKSLIRAIANKGAARVGAIVLARNTEPVLLSSILLVLRLLDTLEDFALAPMTSHVPRFGAFLAAGAIKQFREGVLRALRLSFFLQCSGIIVAGYGIYLVVDLFDLDWALPDHTWFLLLATAHLIASQIRQSLMITVIGNNIIGVRRMLVTAVISCLLAILLIPSYPLIGFICCSYLPIIFILNTYPAKCGCSLMEISVGKFMRVVVFYPLLSVFAALLFSILFSWSDFCTKFTIFVQNTIN